MPNWVTNEITAAPSVIAAMLNSEGRIDFETMMPSPCPVGSDWNGVYGDAETAAGHAESRFPIMTCCAVWNS
jgi:hypothetical protein